MNNEETCTLLRQAIVWHDNGNPAAMAIVTKTWSSAPRPIGSRMIVGADGQFAGSVSGGCVEKEVIQATQECLREQASQKLSFGVANETAWQEGLSCGGAIEVLALPLPAANTAGRTALAKLLQATHDRQPCALCTNAASATVEFLDLTQAPAAGWQGDTFVEYFLPQRRLFLVGATHIAQELAPLAKAAGFAVTVIDPRGAWASASRLPGVELDKRWPDEALESLRLDQESAVVTLAHDPKIDDPAIIAALRGKAGYVGALGSRRTHAKRCTRLDEQGIPTADIGKIHAPVGLDIGANTAAEIAVSIIAQLISHYSTKR